MNWRVDSAVQGNPFSPRTVLALVLFGAGVFVALLWMVGAGMTSGSINNGGNHAGGRGLNGYAALAGLLEKQGVAVRLSRSEGALDDPGLLVLTPPYLAKAGDLDQIIGRRRRVGPTLLILPKWNAVRVPVRMLPAGARKGWVVLDGAAVPPWGNKLDSFGDLDLRIGSLSGKTARWRGFGLSGGFPDPTTVQSLASKRIEPLVRDGGGRVLAGYFDDNGEYPALDAAAGVNFNGKADRGLYPLVIVAEPDLMNNYGFAGQDRAMLALDLVKAAMNEQKLPVIFDLTLNGLARSANLLTLAFTPPFLAATLCLLLAAIALGWRAFARFGPARKPVRAIAFGKRALVANAAGLIRRTGRMHLVAGPYAARARARLARALALPRRAGRAATDAAIDRVLGALAPGAASFSETAARLAAARSPHDVLKAAQDLHALERKLMR